MQISPASWECRIKGWCVRQTEKYEGLSQPLTSKKGECQTAENGFCC